MITQEERLLLNEETMLGDGPVRVFCGLPLAELSASRQRYFARIIGKLVAAGVTPNEIVLAYAFFLATPLDTIRHLVRDLDAFEIALDEWIEKLPSPIPADELEHLASLADRDQKRLEAAQFEVQAKPGETSAPPPPPNC